MFGAIRSEVGTSDNPRKFTGKEYESDVKLYYFAARYYDPYIGRFISRDPVGDGLNWYVYVRNNPLKYIDPTGLRDMTPEEKKKARSIFGGTSLDMNKVAIQDRTMWGRRLGRQNRAMTLRNNIYGNNMDDDLLMHELLHVWQFQNNIIDPLGAGAHHVGWYLSGRYERLYDYEVDSIHDPNRRHFREYDFEQQGAILQDAYRVLEMTDPVTGKPLEPGYNKNHTDFAADEKREIYEQFVREFQEWDQELQRQRATNGTQSSGSWR